MSLNLAADLQLRLNFNFICGLYSLTKYYLFGSLPITPIALYGDMGSPT